MITCPHCKRPIKTLGIRVLAATTYSLNLEEGEYRQKGTEDEREEKSYQLYCRDCKAVITDAEYYAVKDDAGRYDVVCDGLGEYGVERL